MFSFYMFNVTLHFCPILFHLIEGLLKYVKDYFPFNFNILSISLFLKIF